MKTSTVRNLKGDGYHERPWTRALVISICSDCAFPAVAVSQDAGNDAIWDHVAANHLPSRASTGILSGETDVM